MAPTCPAKTPPSLLLPIASRLSTADQPLTVVVSAHRTLPDQDVHAWSPFLGHLDSFSGFSAPAINNYKTALVCFRPCRSCTSLCLLHQLVSAGTSGAILQDTWGWQVEGVSVLREGSFLTGGRGWFGGCPSHSRAVEKGKGSLGSSYSGSWEKRRGVEESFLIR